MKPNIFLINPALGIEDAMTAYWHYVLSVVPGLGQTFVDAVCQSAGLASSDFIGAIDHPSGDSANHPDLLVQCSDWNLLFEHKVDSPLGPQQLQRYLELATARRWKLALLGAARLEVEDEVRRSPVFVSPRDPDRPAHFLWQDLHPILASAHHHLASEFGEFLEHVGLGRYSWAGLGDPFIDAAAAKALLGLYDSIRTAFREPGVQCRRSANSLIYQIRTPFSPVHLINVGPLQSVAQSNPTLRGSVMGVWVWIRRADPGQRILSMQHADLKVGTLPVVVENHADTAGMPYDEAVHNERSYYVPLEYILQDSLDVSAQRLVGFVQSVVAHLRREIVGTVPDLALQPTAAGTIVSRRG